MVTAIANNEVEIGDLAYSTLPIAIKNAGLDDIRVIADDFQDGVDGYWTIRYAVLKDGPIKKVEDLKGKVVATNAEGSAVDIAMKAMLHKHGLEPNRDYTVIEAPFPAMKAMLAEHKVDLIPGILPFALDPQMQKIAHHVVHRQGCHRRVGIRQLPGAQAVHRCAIAPHWSTGWKTRCAFCTGTSIRRTTTRRRRSPPVSVKAPPERMGWVFTKTDAYRDPNMIPDLAALQRNVDMTKELGLRAAPVSTSRRIPI